MQKTMAEAADTSGSVWIDLCDPTEEERRAAGSVSASPCPRWRR
jgi:Mg2+ and Co2+ transporter CorA